VACVLTKAGAAVRVRVRERLSGDCPNGPDEYGHYPCDPKGYFGVAECQTCGRIGQWPALSPADHEAREAERRHETWLESLKDHGP
jgi:predicted NBD/HSP70 family sugar kinase